MDGKFANDIRTIPIRHLNMELLACVVLVLDHQLDTAINVTKKLFKHDDGYQEVVMFLSCSPRT